MGYRSKPSLLIKKNKKKISCTYNLICKCFLFYNINFVCCLHALLDCLWALAYAFLNSKTKLTSSKVRSCAVLPPPCAVNEIVAMPPRRSQPHNLKGGSCAAHAPACPALLSKVCMPLLIFSYNLVPSWSVHTFFTISMARLL